MQGKKGEEEDLFLSKSDGKIYKSEEASGRKKHSTYWHSLAARCHNPQTSFPPETVSTHTYSTHMLPCSGSYIFSELSYLLVGKIAKFNWLACSAQSTRSSRRANNVFSPRFSPSSSFIHMPDSQAYIFSS